MTDEKFEQILKQALSPEISEEDIRIKKGRKAGTMNKMIKGITALAACTAFIIVAGVVMSVQNTANNASNSGPNAADYGNPFRITAYAAELKENQAVPVVIGRTPSWVLSGDEETDEIYYAIQTDFGCEGEGIDSITYSINEGAFTISEMENDSILLEEVAYDGPQDGLLQGNLGGIEASDGTILSASRLLKEYTVAYEAQKNDTTTIGICGIRNAGEAFDTIMDGSQALSEARAEAYSDFLDGVEITCTVHFADGTSESRRIGVEGQVMSYAEAGMCEEGFTYDTGEDWQTRDAFFVFQLN